MEAHDAGSSVIEVRPHERLVLVDGAGLALTSGEYDIVATLAAHPGWVFSAGQLAFEDEEFEHSPESVSVLISRIRQKLAAAGAAAVIETVRGFGYRLHGPVALGDGYRDEDATRQLREAAWQLQEAVFDVARSGTSEQLAEATEKLEQARRALYATLAQ